MVIRSLQEAELTFEQPTSVIIVIVVDDDALAALTAAALPPVVAGAAGTPVVSPVVPGAPQQLTTLASHLVGHHACTWCFCAPRGWRHHPLHKLGFARGEAS